MAELIDVDLTNVERAMLRWGLLDWGGPADPSEALAHAMGFMSIEDLHSTRHRLAQAVSDGARLTRRDWTRTLVATEIVWVSNVFGSGDDSRNTFGYSDGDAITILRSIQGKLGQAHALVSGPALG